jgi:aminobenzoyl-glutamate utilization protein B
MLTRTLKSANIKEALTEGAPGHGCIICLAPEFRCWVVAIKELIAAGKLKGTIRFYGTPAEEDLAGKVYGKSRII